MNDDSTHSVYTPRQAIHRYAFALRHLVLEECKYQQFEKTADVELGARLRRIARELTVEQRQHDFGVCLAGREVLQVNADDLWLYSRGDTPGYAAAQDAHGLSSERSPDLALEHNRKRVAEIVARLLQETL